MQPPDRRLRWVPWLYLLPPLIFLLLFTYLPLADMLYYSLTSWDGLDPDPSFVGLANYVRIFTRPEIFAVFGVSLCYLVAAAVQVALSMYLATLLSFTLRLRNVFKGIIFFPYLVNGVAVAFVFLFFFQPGGTLDLTLQFLGLRSLDVKWLGDPVVANWSLASIQVWRYVGLGTILYIGAIQSIGNDVFEAAQLDGANAWHRFRHIIAPSVQRITGLVMILCISSSLAVFEIPFVMLGGANGTATFVIQTYRMAFVDTKVGLASALAVVLLAIVLLITVLVRRGVRDEAELT
ncbi:carbohydrate ABC transporter permease [Kineococcus sp. SYSU DK002]|uniref:carbohydrate ABC transporter permease n=1 Tax=Kineococcus sp. SYSU DK002 TaxID=3383123 RepID=UPI003D7ED648